VPDAEQLNFEVPSGISLRSELSLRGLRFASVNGLLHERTDGQIPSVIFGREEDGRHGNFHPQAYQRVCNNPEWAKRLDKVHTASKRSRARANWQWKELDCSNSSDALLMNIFCYPEVMTSRSVPAMLGIEIGAMPEFGFKPRTPLHGDRRDATEVDMKVDNLLVEAKLTESDFQSARFDLIRRYRDLETIFDLSELPMRDDRYNGYQLIRGILAAHAMECSFCVFCDARRPDLVEAWYGIMRAVRLFDLRCRLKLLTWQELASGLPEELQQFLAAKYGIIAGSAYKSETKREPVPTSALLGTDPKA
jgi:hypothetical protein